MRKNIGFRIVIVSLCIGLVLLIAGSFLPLQKVWAQGENYGLQAVSLETGKPLGRLAYSCQPGKTIHDGVNVINYDNSQLELVAFGTMAITASGGGISLPEEPTPDSWISLSTSQLSIAPNEASQFEFTINIPWDAKPGEHVMGIIVQAVEPTESEFSSSVKLRILVRKALIVNIFIPGPIEIGLEIPSLEQVWGGPYIAFDVALENTGNVLVKAEGALGVADSSGKVIGSFPVNNTGAILPGDTLIYHIDCHDLLPAGQYSASVNINYTAVKPVAATELTDEEITELATERSTTAMVSFEVTKETVEEVVKRAEEEGFELEPWTKEVTAPSNLLLIVSIIGSVLLIAIVILLVVLLRRRRQY